MVSSTWFCSRELAFINDMLEIECLTGRSGIVRSRLSVSRQEVSLKHLGNCSIAVKQIKGVRKLLKIQCADNDANVVLFIRRLVKCLFKF